MKQIAVILAAVIAAAVVSYATVKITAPQNAVMPAKDKETAFERVTRTGKIRCGYANRQPFLLKSPETGKFEGIFYAYTEALGNALNLEIEWTTEVGWGDVIEYLRTDKIDAFCTGLWPVSNRAPHIDFVHPVLYEPLVAYTRADVSRYDYKTGALNDPETRIVTVEGTAPNLVAHTDFPDATKVTLPQLTPLTDVFLYVQNNKADVVLTEATLAGEYMSKNPGEIKQIPLDRPIRAFGLGLAVKRDSYDFKRMLDLGTEELLQTGQIETIISKHETIPGVLYRVDEPYKTLNKKE